MFRVFIIGNSGAARECYWLFRDLTARRPDFARQFHFAGFLDWQGYKGSLKELQPLHRGSFGDHDVHAEDRFVIGVGSPTLRREIFENAKARGATFINLVHPDAYVLETVVLGEGNVLQRGTTVFGNVVIGNGNFINGGASLAHDVVMGDFNFLAPFAMLLGGARVGSGNRLGPQSIMLEHSRMGDGNILAPGAILYKGCRDNCRLVGNPALPFGTIDTP